MWEKAFKNFYLVLEYLDSFECSADFRIFLRSIDTLRKFIFICQFLIQTYKPPNWSMIKVWHISQISIINHENLTRLWLSYRIDAVDAGVNKRAAGMLLLFFFQVSFPKGNSFLEWSKAKKSSFLKVTKLLRHQS